MKIKHLFLAGIALALGSLISVGTAWAVPGFFSNGGNSFLETATLGTTDNFDLRIITNNIERGRISSSGAATLGGTLSVTGATTLSGGATISCSGCITNTNIATALTGKTYDGLAVSSGTITTGVWNGSAIPLAYGGTNANLIASNGGIFYSTGSAGAILSGTATAGQILRSGSSGAPSWSTATYPSTAGTNGNVLTSDGTNWISSAPSVGTYSLLGSSELESAATSFSVSNFTPKENLVVIVDLIGLSATANVIMRFNNDNSNNYQYKTVEDGIDKGSVTSTSRIRIDDTSRSSDRYWKIDIKNIAERNKRLFATGTAVGSSNQYTTGGQWNEASNQISTITFTTDVGSATFGAGSKVDVFGYE